MTKKSPPRLLDPNVGYDKDGKWRGMTKKEVERLMLDFLRHIQLLFWKPPSPPS
jgi:hypothetical protein